MPKKQGSKDVAPMIRGAFVRAVKALEDKGKPLSKIILKELEENPLATLKAISSFCPKELDVTQRKAITDISELNDEELEQLASFAASVLSGEGEDEESQSTTVTH